MKSFPLSVNNPVPFYLINQDIVRLLDKFVYNQIKYIPHPMRFNIIKKSNHNNLQCFLNLYNHNFLDRYEGAVSNDFYDNSKLTGLYDLVLLIIGGVSIDFISKDNFNLRLMLIEGILDVSTDNIEEYLDDSPIKFHLFAFLYDIIFKELELSESKKEILKYRFGYSDKYERLTKTEMAEKLSITSGAVYNAEQSLERDIRDVIKVFKVFSPFYSYKSKYLSDKEMVKISPAVFDCIRREEGEEEMTDAFIAKVLSVIYNYAIDDEYCRVNEDYLLIYRGDTKNTMIRFGNQEAERN